MLYIAYYVHDEMNWLLHSRQVFIISIHWFIFLIFPILHSCSHNRIIFQSFSLQHTFHYEFQTFLIWIDNDHLKSLQKWPLMFLILWPSPSHLMDVLMLRCYQTWHHPSYNKHCGITQGPSQGCDGQFGEHCQVRHQEQTDKLKCLKN